MRASVWLAGMRVGWWLGWADGIKKRVGKIQSDSTSTQVRTENLTIVRRAEFFNADGRLGYTRIFQAMKKRAQAWQRQQRNLSFDSERLFDWIDWQSKKKKKSFVFGA
jgi:hypothetical protein